MPSNIRPNILRMKPYPPGKPIEEVQRELGLTTIDKLASNENPLGPSPLAVQAMIEAASGTHIYPDARSWNLRQALAEKHGVSPESIMLGNGSDEVIAVLGNMFLEPGTEMVMGDPSFLRYDAAAEVAAAELVKVPLTTEWIHDLPQMAKACTDTTRLVFIANPGNPTGTIVRQAEFDAFLSALPATATVVLDEAYAEYVDDPDYPDAISLVKSGKPVIALRTFSKAFGLAGVRIGYGVADPTIVEAYDAARMPFDVNLLAQAAACAALKDHDHLRKTVEANAQGRARFVSEMSDLGLKTVPSQANFVCVKVGNEDLPYYQALLRRGVIVRPGTVLGMPGYLRVSIGTDEQMERFYSAFKAVLEESKVSA